MQAIIDLIKQSTELVIALGALAVAAVSIYVQIRNMLKQKAIQALRGNVIELITQAKFEPDKLNHSLVNKASISEAVLKMPGCQHALVACALSERHSKQLKRAGLSDYSRLCLHIQDYYKILEPLLSRMPA